MTDDDEEGGFGGLYDGGHWEWDDAEEILAFVRWVYEHVHSHIRLI